MLHAILIQPVRVIKGVLKKLRQLVCHEGEAGLQLTLRGRVTLKPRILHHLLQPFEVLREVTDAVALVRDTDKGEAIHRELWDRLGDERPQLILGFTAAGDAEEQLPLGAAPLQEFLQVVRRRDHLIEPPQRPGLEIVAARDNGVQLQAAIDDRGRDRVDIRDRLPEFLFNIEVTAFEERIGVQEVAEDQDLLIHELIEARLGALNGHRVRRGDNADRRFKPRAPLKEVKERHSLHDADKLFILRALGALHTVTRECPAVTVRGRGKNRLLKVRFEIIPEVARRIHPGGLLKRLGSKEIREAQRLD